MFTDICHSDQKWLKKCPAEEGYSQCGFRRGSMLARFPLPTDEPLYRFAMTFGFEEMEAERAKKNW